MNSTKHPLLVQGCSQGGSLGSEEPPPPPPKTKKCPPKGPLECMKMCTITICLVNINLDTVEDLDKLLSNQLGHACSKITIVIHRKVMQRNYPPNCLATALWITIKSGHLVKGTFRKLSVSLVGQKFIFHVSFRVLC